LDVACLHVVSDRKYPSVSSNYVCTILFMLLIVIVYVHHVLIFGLLSGDGVAQTLVVLLN